MNEAHTLPKGYDAADALAAGWTPEALAAAIRWEPIPRPETKPESVENAPGDQSGSNRLEPYFEETDKGLYFRGIHKAENGDFKHASPIRVCSPIWIRARTRTPENALYGRLVELKNPDGELVRLAVPYSLLKGDGAELRGMLFDLGLEISGRKDAPGLLIQYFKESAPRGWARCTPRTGWQGPEPGRIFVTPEWSRGQGEEEWIFLEEGARVVQLGESGTLDEWRDQVSALAVGNSRVVFALSCAFAAPLLALIGEESGGVHLFGDSTNPSGTGKTTTFHVAASVYGPHEYMKGHRATDNGLEAPAVQHTDMLLLLNDIQQADPKKTVPTVYMLANETEKIRGARMIGSRPIKTWRTLFLSNGETPFATYARGAGIDPPAGALSRMPDVPADAGAGHGCFENLHGFESGKELAKALNERAARYYGTAGPAFIEQVISCREALPEAIKTTRDEFVREALSDYAKVAAPVGRVADRFGLVAAAGEFAIARGITGWEPHEAERAVMRCFQDWLRERGGPGNLEEEKIKANVLHFIESNGDAQFMDWDRADKGDDHRRQTMNLAGFARYRYESRPTRYYILRERFRRDVVRPYPYRDAETVLRRAGWLIPSGETPPRAMRSVQIPIWGKTRCYVLEIPEDSSPPDAEPEPVPPWGK